MSYFNSDIKFGLFLRNGLSPTLPDPLRLSGWHKQMGINNMEGSTSFGSILIYLVVIYSNNRFICCGSSTSKYQLSKGMLLTFLWIGGILTFGF